MRHAEAWYLAVEERLSAVPCGQLQGEFHTRQSNLLNSPSRIAKEPMSLKRGGGGTMHGEAGCVLKLVTPLRRRLQETCWVMFLSKLRQPFCLATVTRLYMGAQQSGSISRDTSRLSTSPTHIRNLLQLF